VRIYSHKLWYSMLKQQQAAVLLELQRAHSHTLLLLLLLLAHLLRCCCSRSLLPHPSYLQLYTTSSNKHHEGCFYDAGAGNSGHAPAGSCQR
jgi:hypothetical protein